MAEKPRSFLPQAGLAQNLGLWMGWGPKGACPERAGEWNMPENALQGQDSPASQHPRELPLRQTHPVWIFARGSPPPTTSLYLDPSILPAGFIHLG